MSVPASNISAITPTSPPVSDIGKASDLASGKPVSEGDKQDFASVMKKMSADPVSQLSTKPLQPHQPSFLESFAAVQDANMKKSIQSVRDTVKKAPSMSMFEVSLAGIEISTNLTIAATQFQVSGAVGKQAGKGIDTLMRNQ